MRLWRQVVNDTNGLTDKEIEAEEAMLLKIFQSKVRIARRSGEEVDLAVIELRVREGRRNGLARRLRGWMPHFGCPKSTCAALARYTEGDGLTLRGFMEGVD